MKRPRALLALVGITIRARALALRDAIQSVELALTQCHIQCFEIVRIIPCAFARLLRMEARRDHAEVVMGGEGRGEASVAALLLLLLRVLLLCCCRAA